ncbi:hypothetical protein BAY61_27230 [Prauserella marina]|uniref:Uncharacterized protein n=1 Tax=Prauserella marina TaxID=530584 RepID=A0A222VVX8_9PSEU|nr:hypothetical protein [Prauserella marina]ASR38089.1 hypothetical protein BAY61_27230 [Prauserella marina]PWV78755.1 hypothetical protein DES30_104494 [Prauserella marina]SDC92910.1 hypothetical protein SAMN05421630_104493 [Prauserella marina]
MLFAPVLSEVAARMAGAGPEPGSGAVPMAYRLRDAVELVRPDWVVTHHDQGAEARAARTAGDVELVDVALAALDPVAGLVELVEVLAALYPDTVVAASVTGPAGMAAAMESGGDSADLLDCGDVLAELVSAYVGAGASRVLVWEPEVGDDIADEVISAHTSIVRRLDMLGVPGVLCGGAAIDSAGYRAHALNGGGREATLVPPNAFSRGAAGSFAELLPGSAAHGLVLTDGPVSADCDLGLLSAVSVRRTG